MFQSYMKLLTYKKNALLSSNKRAFILFGVNNLRDEDI